MGWFGGKKEEENEKAVEKTEETKPNGANNQLDAVNLKGESVDVQRPEPTGPLPSDVSVFEFGIAGAAGNDMLTLAGYCSVSDEMEPCRWVVLPALQEEAPGFRVAF